MTIRTERGEALEISKRIMTQLVTFALSPSGDAAANLRWAMGRYISNFYDLIVARNLGPSLFECFERAFVAGASLNSMDRVREALFAEAPRFPLGHAIVNAAVIFSFVEQSKIITKREFISQTEVDEMIDRMVLVIEEIKLNKADFFVVADYRNFIALSAFLIQHLAATRRVLPRIVKYRFPINYPSLSMANRIYGDGSRSEDLIAENKTIHPAFMQRHVMALSQ